MFHLDFLGVILVPLSRFKYNAFPSLFMELNATTNAVYRGGVMFSLFFPARSLIVTKFEKPKDAVFSRIKRITSVLFFLRFIDIM